MDKILMRVVFVIAVTIGILFSSCRKDIPPVRPEENVTLGSSGGVFILNEGNFMFGNAKVSYHNLHEQSTIVDLYSETNGTGVGDVLQSMRIFNNKAYLVVNNSAKIEVCNPITLAKLSTITGFNSPRYLLPVSNNKAFVTDLYANKIWIVDLSNNTISGSIPMNGWCEDMHEQYGKVYVANYEKGMVYVLNSSTNAFVDSITVVQGASEIEEDKNGKLWVLCSGDAASSVLPSLFRIDPINNVVEQSFLMGGSPSKLVMNPTNDTLYYLSGGVHKMSIYDSSVPATSFIPTGTSNFYGLGVNPHTGQVFVADAIDYIQDGKVLIYSPNGVYLREFNVGIIPSGFVFQ